LTQLIVSEFLFIYHCFSSILTKCCKLKLRISHICKLLAVLHSFQARGLSHSHGRLGGVSLSVQAMGCLTLIAS